VRECAAVLAPAGFTVLGLEALADTTPIEETGSTFEENARLKAEGYSLRTPHPVLADDSGLEVDALGGGPGVLSARYGGPDLTDPDRCMAILAALADTPEDKRTARFRCVLALASAGRTLATFDGVVHGVILRAPRGANGFGYDPIFFHPPSGCAFAELTRAEKELVSHRGLALRRFVDAAGRPENRGQSPFT
jgi:XTP/dITP diphosphohydrolase